MLFESISRNMKLCSHVQNRCVVDRNRPVASGDAERQGWGCPLMGTRVCFLMWTHCVAEDSLE